MSQLRYQITLSLDGNHSVSVSADDPTAVKDGLAWARGIYLKLQARTEQRALLSSSQVVHHDLPPAPQKVEICGVHQLPMHLMNGKRGPFWSCHEKLSDGSWCNYRPTGSP